MSDESENEAVPTVGISPSRREHLHRQLDRLLDAQNSIAQACNLPRMTDDIANGWHREAERLVVQVCALAAEIAGPDARAIAFRHRHPKSREALANFLKCVAEMAAPYAYATYDLGIETFTWTDVMAMLDDLKSLDHGDIPNRLAPADKARRRTSGYAVLKEQWRAVRWVSYFTEFGGRPSKEAAKLQVAAAYGVTGRTISNWEHDTAEIEIASFRDWELDQAREDGRLNRRPDFTLAPFDSSAQFDAIASLRFDGGHYKSIK